MLIGGSTASKPKRISVKALVVLGLASWCSFIVLDVHYSATRPHQPDATAGRIYQLNTHGSYAYLTIGEQLRLWCLGLGSLSFFIASGILARFWKIPTNTYAETPAQIWSQPYQDYKKIRATYESDKDDADGR